jgi:hypothetical protein
MRQVKIGDEVKYVTFSSPTRIAIIEEIEICKRGEKNGRSVNSCDLEQHLNGTITLSDGHWAYFDQIKQVINKERNYETYYV